MLPGPAHMPPSVQPSLTFSLYLIRSKASCLVLSQNSGYTIIAAWEILHRFYVNFLCLTLPQTLNNRKGKMFYLFLHFLCLAWYILSNLGWIEIELFFFCYFLWCLIPIGFIWPMSLIFRDSQLSALYWPIYQNFEVVFFKKETFNEWCRLQSPLRQLRFLLFSMLDLKSLSTKASSTKRWRFYCLYV